MINKLIPLIIACALLVLSGCHSSSKDERYNNMGPTEIYAEGVKNVDKKLYSRAVEDFEALESRYPFGEYADKAQLGAIYAYYMDEDYPAGLPAVERFIRMYPRHPSVDYAYYMKGLIHFSETEGFLSNYLPSRRQDRDSSSAKKAIAAFNTVITQYPRSIYVENAKMRLVFLRNLVAQSELTAARFYLQKGANLAAVNRASYVIANFDQTPSMPEALAIMVMAYRNLELPELAQSSYEVLKLNYPNSSFVEELS